MRVHVGSGRIGSRQPTTDQPRFGILHVPEDKRLRPARCSPQLNNDRCGSMSTSGLVKTGQGKDTVSKQPFIPLAFVDGANSSDWRVDCITKDSLVSQRDKKQK